MGKETNISWTHHTFNAWLGCQKVSPGCTNCYAEQMDNWLHKGAHWGTRGVRKMFGADHWRQPIHWNAAAEAANERRRVFCSSVADVFEDRPELEETRIALWELILATPHLDWLLLTKRPENFDRLLLWGSCGAYAEPLRNVWLGVTAENQEYASIRIPILQRTPAVRRFVSYEPALGPIDWTPFLSSTPNIHWVIFGDESGRRRRPADIEWARQTRDACEAHGVAYHFKQWCGANVDGITGEREKKKIHLPLLDGVRHAAFPPA